MCCHSRKTIMWEFKTANFVIRALIEPDDDLDLSWDDSGETAANLNSGLWEAFQTEITVSFRGTEIAADYLGGSVYERPADFFKEHYGLAAKSRADGCNYGAYFPDMVRTAIGEARKALAAMPKIRAA
jgi:hypothetical protein